MSKVRNCKPSVVSYLAVLTVFVNLFIGMPVGYSLGAQVSMDLQVVYDKTTDSVTLRWFPAFPDQIETFEIVCYSQSGEIKKTQTMAAQDRTCIIQQVVQLGLYEVEVQAFAAGDTEIEVTPRERVFSGTSKAATVSILAAGQLDVSLVSCDSRNFPFIYLTVRVNEDGQPVGDLTVGNFEVTEDGRLQTDFFDVTPPGTGGGVRMADIVFLIDTSGSMGGEIAAVRNNCVSFANALAASDINYRLGLVRFGNSSGANPGIIGGGLTENAETFKSWVATLGASGGYEPGFAAIRLAIQSYNFRPGAQKVFIVITDEDSDDRNLASTVNLILANDVTVHTAVNASSGTTYADYIGPSSVRGVSGGLTFSVTAPLTSVLDTIAGHAANTYIVRYRTDNPIVNGVERQGICTVDNGVSTDSVPFSYIPGGAPVIVRTAATIALHNDSLVAGSSPTIAAKVTDAAEPFVQNVTLYVRTTSSGSNYTPVGMATQGGNVYAIQVPGGNVQSPGVDYYIRATDGQVSSSDPSVDPEIKPYQIAVLPNIAPTINHTPPEYGIAGQDLDLEVAVADDTHYLKKVTLYYRLQGELLWNAESITFAAPGPTTATEMLTIGGEHIAVPALEYYIEVTDDLDLSRLWPEGGADNPQVVGIGMPVNAFWSGPEPGSVKMGEPYRITVSVFGTESWKGGTVKLKLQETVDYPTDKWNSGNVAFLNDSGDWACYVADPYGGPPILVDEDYEIGIEEVELSVPAGVLPSTAYFEGSHKWAWIPPFDLPTFGAHAFGLALSLGLDYLAPGTGVTLSLAVHMETLLRSVSWLNYSYTGFCNGVAEADFGSAIVSVPDYKKFALAGSTGFAITASGATAIGLPLIWNPVGQALLITEAILFGTSELSYIVAADPPDMDYTVVARPEHLFIPEIQEMPESKFKTAAISALELEAIMAALKSSLEKYEGAKLDGAAEWQVVQLGAVNFYAQKAIEILLDLACFWEGVVPGIAVPTAEQIQQARDWVAQNGLPAIEVEVLKELGFTQDQIDALAALIATMDDAYFKRIDKLPDFLRVAAEGLSATTEELPSVPPSSAIEAIVDLKPDRLNLKSAGRWVTCYIELPEGYDVSDIDVNSLMLQNTVIAESKPTEVGDYDNDGIPDLMVKFDRQQLIQLLDPGEQIIALTGQLTDGTPLAGIDAIRVIH